MEVFKFLFYSFSVSLQRKEDFGSFIEREFEISNMQVKFFSLSTFGHSKKCHKQLFIVSTFCFLFQPEWRYQDCLPHQLHHMAGSWCSQGRYLYTLSHSTNFKILREHKVSLNFHWQICWVQKENASWMNMKCHTALGYLFVCCCLFTSILYAIVP